MMLEKGGGYGVSVPGPGKENVSIRASLDIPTATAPHQLSHAIKVTENNHQMLGDRKMPQTPNRFHPIFFMDQPEGYMLMGQAEDTGNRYTVWTIDQFDKQVKGFPIDQLQGTTTAYRLDGWHMLRIHQDGERTKQGDYFEFWVDQVALGHIDLTHMNFAFSRLPTRFYIGAYPAGGNHSKLHFMKGKIREIHFDPNDICWTCFQ